MNSSLVRIMMIVGGIAVGCLGLFWVGMQLYEGYSEREALRRGLETQEAELQGKLARLERNKKEVDRWKAVSLPGNLTVSGLMFKNFLQELLLKHKLVLQSMSEPNRLTTTGARGAVPVASHISIEVVFESSLMQLTSFLKEFYSVNVPHSIKSMVVEPLGKGGEAKLRVTMKVDALAMDNVPLRDSIIANPTMAIVQLEMIAAMKRLPVGMLFALSQLTNTGLHGQNKLSSKSVPDRDYADMLKKNAFAGLAPTTSIPTTGNTVKSVDYDILKYTQLTGITANLVTEEGLLRIRKTNKYVKLRAEGGLNEFEIRDGDNQLVLKGKVLAIKPRDLVFETKGKAYVLHVGQFLEDALKKELTPDELKKYDAELTAVEQKNETN